MRSKVIVCPNCGKEHVLEEVFYPEDLFGKNIDVIRDENNKIENIIGNKAELEEEFFCDCGCHFLAKANLTFETSVIEDKKDDFDEDFSSTIYENRVSL